MVEEDMTSKKKQKQTGQLAVSLVSLADVSSGVPDLRRA